MKSTRKAYLDVLGAIILDAEHNLVEDDLRRLGVEHHRNGGHADLWLLTLVLEDWQQNLLDLLRLGGAKTAEGVDLKIQVTFMHQQLLTASMRNRVG
jgi:hypothetical protein